MERAQKPLIIAHRGASDECPENSLEALQRAIDIGADGIEFDLQMTKDEELVLFHDEIRKGKKIIETDASELFAAGLPSFEEALALSRRAFYMVELKSHPAIAKKMAKIALAKGEGHKNLILASFCSETIRELQRQGSPHPCYAIAETEEELASFGKVDGYALHYQWAGSKRAEEILASSTLFYWTVDSEERAASLQADGIITNRPRLLQRVLHPQKNPHSE